jgi:hypothetical protein
LPTVLTLAIKIPQRTASGVRATARTPIVYTKVYTGKKNSGIFGASLSKLSNHPIWICPSVDKRV